MSQNRRRNYSVIVIPDDGSRTREFKVSALLLRAMLIFALIDLGLILFGGLSIWRLKVWSEAMDKLRVENARLRVEADKVQNLSQALERLKATDQQIRAMLSGSVRLNEPPYEEVRGPEPRAPSSAGGGKGPTGTPEGGGRRGQ